jgi:HD-like signal output (HDOD) protein
MIETYCFHEEYAGRFAKVASREAILQCAEQIAPLPQATLKVLELLDDPESDAGRLADAISTDARLTAAILKLAHSPAYARTGGVLTVQDAITLIGANQLRALVLSKLLVGLLKREAIDQMVLDHALATGLIARHLAEIIARPMAEEVFLLGLLHSLGQFVFLANPQTRLAFVAVVRRIQETGVDYVTAELEEIGFSHNLIGALVANRWNFPREICQTLLCHTETIETIATPPEQKRAIVQLAELLAHASFIGHPPGYPVDLERVQRLASLLGVSSQMNRGVIDLIVAARNKFQAEARYWST